MALEFDALEFDALEFDTLEFDALEFDALEFDAILSFSSVPGLLTGEIAFFAVPPLCLVPPLCYFLAV